MATKRKMDMSLDEIIETKRNEGLKLSQNTSIRSNFAHPNMDDFIQFVRLKSQILYLHWLK